MGETLPIFQKYGNITVEPSAVSSSVSVEPDLKAIKFTNSGLNLCYVKLGLSSLTASSSDTPILPGESVVLGKSADDNTCAFVSALGTVLNIKEGEMSEVDE